MRKRYLILILLAGLTAYLYLNRYGSTPAFKDSTGATIKGSVAEMHRYSLGGVEQSVVIRGRNAKAPILIWLHGGPAMDSTGMARFHNAALEDHFLVVYWTQRGGGRSYDSSIPAATMNLPQFVKDLDQLVGLLKKRFGQQKVVLMGHSWGTNIGVVYAQQHPENVAAYVGIGQIANAAESERRSYAFALAAAKRRGNKQALAELIKLGPPPYPFSSMMAQRGWLEEFGGGSFRKPTSFLSLMATSYRASEMTWLDGVKFQAGVDFSGALMAPQVATYNWMRDAPRFKVPVFIAAGRYDYNTPSGLAYEYYEKIEAPSKRFKWFEQSAHSPPFEEPAAFNAFIIGEVLPVAVQSASITPK